MYNGPLTIPAVAGWYDVAFQTPFVFTGGGFYLAYEWETTAPVAASGTYECDDYLVQGLRGGTDATAFPATLTVVSNYRPLLRVGYAPVAQDAAVLRTAGPGKIALQSCVTPYPVQAVVRNMGSQPLVNLACHFHARNKRWPSRYRNGAQLWPPVPKSACDSRASSQRSVPPVNMCAMR